MRILLVIFSLSIILLSCSDDSSEYREEIKQLNTLLNKVNEAEAKFDGYPHENISLKLDSIQNTIDFVEANYGGEMSRENGLLLDKFRNTKNIIKKFKQRSSQIRSELIRTKSQLENFSSALSIGATLDKNDQPIDKTYVETNMTLEKKAAEKLVESIDQLEARIERFHKEFSIRAEALNPYINSLK